MIFIPVGDINPRERFPWVNYSLIAANVAVFFWSVSVPERTVLAWALVPSEMSPVTMLSSMFLHGDVFHLAGNMLFLWIAGDNVEDRCGPWLYFAFYVAAGLVAGGAHVLTVTEASAHIPTVGASGSISGVLGAYLILFPWARIRFFYWVIIVAGFVTLRSWFAIGAWFALQLVSVLAATDDSMGGVAYWAHIGGFAFGFGAMFLLAGLRLVRAPRRAALNEDWDEP
jgi:membrane associated rhomboid family serine protease